MVRLTLIGEGRRTSITDAYEHCGLLHPDTFFDHMRTKGVGEVERILQATHEDILDSARARGLLPNAAAFAFDIHVDADYSTKHEGTIGWKDLPGTNYGMAYLSADCLDPAARFTYAFTPIRQATNRADALRAQVARIRARTQITLALLDRGFANVASFLVFVEPRIPFVTPMPGNQRIDRLKEVAWRERVKVPNKPYWYHVVPEYTIEESGKTGRSVTVQLVFFFEPDPQNKEKEVCFVFATNPGELKLERILELASRYRERWGIETGYRCKDPVRLRTTSDHYPTRLFLQLSSILFNNLWILVRALHARGEIPRLRRRRKDRYPQRNFRDDVVAELVE